MRFLLGLLLLTPAAAWADPTSIVGLIAYALQGTAYAWVGYALIAATVVYGSVDRRRQAKHARMDAAREHNASLEDRSVTTTRALPFWRIPMGRCIAGGDIVAIFTSDKTGTRDDGTSYTH